MLRLWMRLCVYGKVNTLRASVTAHEPTNLVGSSSLKHDWILDRG